MFCRYKELMIHIKIKMIIYIQLYNNSYMFNNNNYAGDSIGLVQLG